MDRGWRLGVAPLTDARPLGRTLGSVVILAVVSSTLTLYLSRETMESAPPPLPVAPTAYRVADLRIDVTHRRVTRAGTEITLSDLSFELLLELTRGAPNVVSFEQLMQRRAPPESALAQQGRAACGR